MELEPYDEEKFRDDCVACNEFGDQKSKLFL